MPRFIELSHPLEDGMAAYPGLPRPKIGAHIDHAASRPHYDDQAEFYLGRIEMACNVGTYIDSPFHRYPDRALEPQDRAITTQVLLLEDSPRTRTRCAPKRARTRSR